MGLRRRLEKLLQEEKEPRRVARGFAIGAAIAVTPTVGIQTALALLLSFITRSSKIAAVAATIILNPIGYIPPGPWAVANYYVGVFLIGRSPISLVRLKAIFSPEGEPFSIVSTMRRLGGLGEEIMLPVCVGAAVCAVCAATLSYILLQRFIKKRSMQEVQEKGCD